MATVNPPPRRRIVAANTAPRPRTRPVAEIAHDLFDPYDGPAHPSPVRDETTGQLQPTQRTLGERLSYMAQADRPEAETLILSTLHQFLLARTPPDVIAQRMNMSLRSLRMWREKLNNKLREDAKNKDPFDYIGTMLGEMEEIKASAWREVASAKPLEWTRRMAAISVIMKANNEINRLLQVTGMYENQPMRQPLAAASDEDNGAGVLKDMAQNFLTGGYEANSHFRASPRPGDVIVESE